MEKNKTEEELKKEIERLEKETDSVDLRDKQFLESLSKLINLWGKQAQLLGFQQGQAEARKEFLEWLNKNKYSFKVAGTLVEFKQKIKELENLK